MLNIYLISVLLTY